jgi:multiple sugar transport system substrate-binding protein
MRSLPEKQSCLVTRRRLLVTGGGLIGTLFGACSRGGSQAGQATVPQIVACRSRLEFFDPASPGIQRHNSYSAVINSFTAARPGCTVELVFVESAQRLDKLTAAIAGGVPPALVGLAPGETRRWVAIGVLASVDDLFKREKFQSTDFPVALWKQMSYGGKLWFMPGAQTNPDFVLFWNTAHFSEAGLNPEQGPTTIAELDTMIQQLTRVQGDDYERVGMIPWDLYGHGNTIQAWGYAFGGSFYDEARDELTFTYPRIIRAVEWYTGWAQWLGLARVAKLRQVTLPSGTHFFASGRLSISPITSGQLKVSLDYDPTLRVGAGVMPGEAPGKAGTVAVGGWAVAAVAESKQREEAWDFMKFAGASDEGTTIMARTGAIPGWLRSPGLEELARDPLWKAYVDALRRAEFPQLGFYAPGGLDLTPIQEVLDGKRSVVDALQAINSDANARHNRWKSQAQQKR